MLKVDKVAIIGFISKMQMRNPFNIPTSAPPMMPKASTGPGGKLLLRIYMPAHIRKTFIPTEMSIPDVKMTKVMPTAIIAVKLDCCRMFLKLVAETNEGCKMPSTIPRMSEPSRIETHDSCRPLERKEAFDLMAFAPGSASQKW